ncbi:nicotinate-nucleotide adenylyltransferase [Anaerolineae bacterium]|nr:nicotinate-nucleotide adenylyltransferase [Anaerolineae bacterium]
MGGTFDPPHTGHLLAASDAVDHLALDRLVFIPAAQQPLKQHQEAAPAGHRLRMLQVMTQGDARFSVDEIEIQRTGLSFTVETLEEYARRLPDSERFLLLGADAFALLDQWRDPARVVSLAHVVVLTRASAAGAPPDERALEDVIARVRAIGGPGASAPRVIPTRRVDVSSTEIRARVRAGRPIRGFVTDAVASYIESNGLYR